MRNLVVVSHTELGYFSTIPPAERRWRQEGGRKPPGWFYVWVFLGGFFARPRRTVRESYQGFHFRDFVVVVVIFSKAASMRTISFQPLARVSSQAVFRDCNQCRRAFRAMYPPACAAHALSCMSALLLCFPIIFIYLQYLCQCFMQPSADFFLFVCFCFKKKKHEPHKEHQRIMTDSTKESGSHCSSRRSANQGFKEGGGSYFSNFCTVFVTVCQHSDSKATFPKCLRFTQQ